MNQMTPPPTLELIPESAPFSLEQRTWLNGFFAGIISLDGTSVAGAGGCISAGR